MKITADDPRLTALALGELPEDEARKLRAEVEASPELSKELALTMNLAGYLGDSLGDEELSLGAERREQVLQAGKKVDVVELASQGRRRNRNHTFKVVAGAAAAVAVTFALLNRTAVDGPALADGAELGGSVANQGEGEFRARPDTKTISIDEVQNVSLQLGIPMPDLLECKRWISEKRTVLPQDLSEAASWVSSLGGDREPQLSFADLGVSAEMGECPWDLEKQLLLITLVSLRESGGDAHSVSASLELEGERVTSVKLVGKGSDAPKSKEEHDKLSLPAGESQVLLYELVLKPGISRIGAVHVDTIAGTGEEKSGYLPISDSEDQAKPSSNDLEIASVLAEFALWNGQKEPVNHEHLKSIASRAEKHYAGLPVGKTREALDVILLARDLIR